MIPLAVFTAAFLLLSFLFHRQKTLQGLKKSALMFLNLLLLLTHGGFLMIAKPWLWRGIKAGLKMADSFLANWGSAGTALNFSIEINRSWIGQQRLFWQN